MDLSRCERRSRLVLEPGAVLGKALALGDREVLADPETMPLACSPPHPGAESGVQVGRRQHWRGMLTPPMPGSAGGRGEYGGS